MVWDCSDRARRRMVVEFGSKGCDWQSFLPGSRSSNNLLKRRSHVYALLRREAVSFGSKEALYRSKKLNMGERR
jgi:hypothetical protein